MRFIINVRHIKEGVCDENVRFEAKVLSACLV